MVRRPKWLVIFPAKSLFSHLYHGCFEKGWIDWRVGAIHESPLRSLLLVGRQRGCSMGVKEQQTLKIITNSSSERCTCPVPRAPTQHVS